jgi:hypothetical protein
MEDRHHPIPRAVMAELLERVPVLVERRDRGATWNEEYVGLGCICSVTDYGRSAEMGDAELIALARERIARGAQACHVVDDADRLPDAIIVAAHRSGYSVRALHGGASVVPLGEPHDSARRRGEAVLNVGGNGTLAAALEIIER